MGVGHLQRAVRHAVPVQPTACEGHTQILLRSRWACPGRNQAGRGSGWSPLPCLPRTKTRSRRDYSWFSPTRARWLEPRAQPQLVWKVPLCRFEKITYSSSTSHLFLAMGNWRPRADPGLTTGIAPSTHLTLNNTLKRRKERERKRNIK